MLNQFLPFLTNIIRHFGYLGMGLIIFSESGLLFGIFLPGDSLIFLAGIFAAQGYFNIALLIIVIFFAAAAGDNLGYFIGKKLGRKVFKYEGSVIFNQKNLARTEDFFEEYGRFTFMIQRFIPVIRTFGPLLGGVGKMDYRMFFLFDLIGSALWGAGVTLLGFYLGKTIPNIDNYLPYFILFIIIISFIPAIIKYRKQKKQA